MSERQENGIQRAMRELSELRAERDRLREACEYVFAMIEVELYESPADDQWHIAAKKIRAALASADAGKGE